MMKKSKTKPQMFTGAKAKQFMKFKITYFPIFSTQQKQPHLLAVFQKKLTILAQHMKHGRCCKCDGVAAGL